MSALKIAEATGQDYAEVKESEYQPGEWSARIYVIDQDYYTVTRGTRPPKVVDLRTDMAWIGDWERVECPWADRRPGTVWRSRCIGE